MNKIIFIVINIIWQIFKIYNRKVFYDKYLQQNYVTFVDYVFSLLAIIIFGFFVYFFSLFNNIFQNVNLIIFFKLLCLLLIFIFYFGKLYVLISRNINIKIKKMFFGISLVLELMIPYLIDIIFWNYILYVRMKSGEYDKRRKNYKNNKKIVFIINLEIPI